MRFSADTKATIFLLALVAVVFADVLLLGNGFYFRDALRDYLPSHAVLRSIVLRGELPLWNRAVSGGQPLAANPGYQLFYPGTWLVFLPRFPFGFHLEIVAHIAIAACGMYRLLRQRSVTIESALFGAIAFAFGGGVLSLTNLLPFLTSVAWWPWILLYAGRYLHGGARRDRILATFTLAMMLLAAEQSVILQSGVLLAWAALSRHETGRSIPGPRLAARLAFLLAASMAIASVQLVPALDLKRDSGRSREITFEDATSWSMPLIRPIELVFPDFAGRITDDGLHFWGEREYKPARIPLIISLYGGVLVGILALAGVLAQVDGWRATTIIAFLSYSVAAGGHAPLVPLLYRFGLFRTIRYPEKFILIGVFALTVFAATVLDRLVADRRIARCALGVAVSATLVAVVMVIESSTPGATVRIARFWNGAGASLAAEARVGWIVDAGRCALACLVLWIALRRPSRAVLMAILLFAAADAGLRVNALAPRMPSRFFDPPSIVAETVLARDQVRLFNQAAWPVWGDHGLTIPPGEATYWTVRNAMLPLSSGLWNRQSILEQDINLTTLLPTADFLQSIWEAPRAPDWPRPFLLMANVGYVLVPDRIAPRASLEADPEKLTPVRVLRVPTLPRYWFADRLVQVDSRSAFVRAMTSQKWSDRVAFVRFPPFDSQAGRVLAVSERASSAEIAVETVGTALLAMSVTPHKYWTATIDGHEAPIVEANIGFSGIVVPKGRHAIALRYRNPLIGVCGAISVLAIASVLVVRRRTRACHPEAAKPR